MTRVLLVDDQLMIRAGLTSLLESTGVILVGEATNGADAIDAVRRLRPDVVLMDLRMPVMDGVAATKLIRADLELAGTGILVLTTFDGDRDVIEAIEAGADGFLNKAAEPDDLVAAITDVAAGRAALSDRAARAMMRHVAESARPPADVELEQRVSVLTPREQDVVRAAAEGLNNSAIAALLFISPLTVKTHLNRAMVKLDARDRGQLVSIAYRAGLVQG